MRTECSSAVSIKLRRCVGVRAGVLTWHAEMDGTQLLLGGSQGTAVFPVTGLS